MTSDPTLRALCIGRHPHLSEHLSRFFSEFGITTRAVVGLEEAAVAAPAFAPDVVLCDYELLATLPLESLERDVLLSRTALIAVSLTRRPTEAHLLDVNGIAGFLYLPTLDPAMALRILQAAAASTRAQYAPPQPAGTSRNSVSLPVA